MASNGCSAPSTRRSAKSRRPEADAARGELPGDTKQHLRQVSFRSRRARMISSGGACRGWGHPRRRTSREEDPSFPDLAARPFCGLCRSRASWSAVRWGCHVSVGAILDRFVPRDENPGGRAYGPPLPIMIVGARAASRGFGYDTFSIIQPTRPASITISASFLGPITTTRSSSLESSVALVWYTKNMRSKGPRSSSVAA
jgi:hypothetical protein